MLAGGDPFRRASVHIPAQVNAQDVALLREQGLNTHEILDVVQSAAFFAWANRLILTLGEPYWPQE